MYWKDGMRSPQDLLLSWLMVHWKWGWNLTKYGCINVNGEVSTHQISCSSLLNITIISLKGCLEVLYSNSLIEVELILIHGFVRLSSESQFPRMQNSQPFCLHQCLITLTVKDTFLLLLVCCYSSFYIGIPKNNLLSSSWWVEMKTLVKSSFSGDFGLIIWSFWLTALHNQNSVNRPHWHC